MALLSQAMRAPPHHSSHQKMGHFCTDSALQTLRRPDVVYKSGGGGGLLALRPNPPQKKNLDPKYG